jgi:hypothetical protein
MEPIADGKGPGRGLRTISMLDGLREATRLATTLTFVQHMPPLEKLQALSSLAGKLLQAEQGDTKVA